MDFNKCSNMFANGDDQVRKTNNILDIALIGNDRVPRFFPLVTGQNPRF